MSCNTDAAQPASSLRWCAPRESSFVQFPPLVHKRTCSLMSEAKVVCQGTKRTRGTNKHDYILPQPKVPILHVTSSTSSFAIYRLSPPCLLEDSKTRPAFQFLGPAQIGMSESTSPPTTLPVSKYYWYRPLQIHPISIQHPEAKWQQRVGERSQKTSDTTRKTPPTHKGKRVHRGGLIAAK